MFYLVDVGRWLKEFRHGRTVGCYKAKWLVLLSFATVASYGEMVLINCFFVVWGDFLWDGIRLFVDTPVLSSGEYTLGNPTSETPHFGP